MMNSGERSTIYFSGDLLQLLIGGDSSVEVVKVSIINLYTKKHTWEVFKVWQSHMN